MQKEKKKGTIILSAYGAKLFGKKLLLDENIYTKKMDRTISLIPIEMDEDRNLFVPRGSVPKELYIEYVKILGSAKEYYDIISMVRDGTYRIGAIETPFLDSKVYLGDFGLFGMEMWEKKTSGPLHKFLL